MSSSSIFDNQIQAEVTVGGSYADNRGNSTTRDRLRENDLPPCPPLQNPTKFRIRSYLTSASHHTTDKVRRLLKEALEVYKRNRRRRQT